MVAFDLVMRERTLIKTGEAGPIETRYLEAPEKFIGGLEQSKALQNLANSMDSNDYLSLIKLSCTSGIQHVTDKILQDLGQAQKGQQAPQAQQAMENQPKEIEPPAMEVPHAGI